MTYSLAITSQSTNNAIKLVLAAIPKDETTLVLHIKNINYININMLDELLATFLTNIPSNIITLDLSERFVHEYFMRKILTNLPSQIITLSLHIGACNTKEDTALYSLIPAGVIHLIVHVDFGFSSDYLITLFKMISENIKEITLSYRDVCGYKSEEQIAIARSLSHVLKVNIAGKTAWRTIKYENPITNPSKTVDLFKKNIGGNLLIEAHNQLMDIKDHSGSLILPSDIVLEVLSFLTMQPNKVKDFAEEQQDKHLEQL